MNSLAVEASLALPVSGPLASGGKHRSEDGIKSDVWQCPRSYDALQVDTRDPSPSRIGKQAV